jgi:hypothetical protein
MSRLYAAILLLLALCLAGTADAARRERLALRPTHLELPGAPSVILPVDLDGDGRRDLVVVVAYTEWDQISIEERTEMDDIEGLVEVLTIIPALTDRRELWVFSGRADGTYTATAPPLALAPSVLSLEAGPPAHPVLVLTDDGLSELHFEDGALSLKELVQERSLLARTESFLPDLGLVHDLDGDGRGDVLLPTRAGTSVFLTGEEGLVSEGATRVVFPDARRSRSGLGRHFPLPEVRDVDGDHLADLVLLDHRDRYQGFYVLRGAGGGRFEPALAPLGEPEPERSEDEDEDDEDEDEPAEVVYFGDLDGDGIAEYVTEEDLSSDEGGMRKEMREAKRPPYRYRFYRLEKDFGMAAEPYAELEALGYAFGADDDDGLVPGGFQDLNGDGREDLITLTLDFSMLQAVRILATRSISIGLDFHVFCQNEKGSFGEVKDLDLSGKFRLNLNNLALGQLSQFAGDFDGDGRIDFLQLGRDKDVSIHRGQEGCRYAAAPDLLLRLEEAPRDVALVRVEDYDGDDLSDLLIIQPQKTGDAGTTAPVRLDIYLSGGAGE